MSCPFASFVTEQEVKKVLDGSVYLEWYFNILLDKGLKVAGVKYCPEPKCNVPFWVDD
jgi:hypothetical protein